MDLFPMAAPWRHGVPLVIKTTLRVGQRYTCEMRFANRQLLAEWFPDTPKKLTPEESADYLRGRDIFLGEVAQLIGGNVLVVG